MNEEILINENNTEENQNENYRDKYIYLLAEFENYKKRIIREKSDLKRDVQIDTIMPFLQINNYLEMAKIAIERSDNIEAIKYGLNMIFSQFENTFANLNISKIKTIGEKFDHNVHNAVECKVSDDVPCGYIISELSPGYKLNDYVMVASNVIVSSGNKENL